MKHILLAIAWLCSMMVYATDGMNLEGWGPVSTSMGGTGMAYDTGMAALMNNPATLILFENKQSRFDLSITRLGPEVSSTLTTPNGQYVANSASDAFYMPSFGWGKRIDKVAFGVAMFAQGGMGCEYGVDSWMSDPCAGGNCDLTNRLTNRSEVSVGRFMGGFSWEINPRFSVGASLDFVWAGLDLQMAMSEAQFMDMVNPQAQTSGHASGSMIQAMGMLYEPFGGMGMNRIHHAYFDFSDNSDFTGQAKGYGWAGKLGFLWRATDTLDIGGAWHSETRVDDLEYDAAVMSMGVSMDVGLLQGGRQIGQYMDIVMPLQGEISVNDFQWPATWALGLAWRPNHKWLVAMDGKMLQWSQVMDDFAMTFTADPIPRNGMLSGLTLDAALYQNWDDQMVWSSGVSYTAMEGLFLRGGLNYADSPIPAQYVNPLFPAIIQRHLMLGLGFELGHGQLDLAMVRSFPEEETAPGNGRDIPPVTSSHEQFNWSLQYTYKF